MKIAHIADIHIRLKERHAEYKEVFENLYKDLAEVQPDRIILAGDIVHSKITMSPELFVVTSDFFKSLQEIAPVDLIAGNHDMNMSNFDRLDALTPIVDSVKDHGFGLTYWNKTGLYEVPNTQIVYGIDSLTDEKHMTRLTKNMKKSGKIYIALYHGAIAGCILDNNYSYADAKVSMRTFNNFDYVMLGDIHKCQDMTNYKEKEINKKDLQKYLDDGWQISP